jgi:DNA-binding winged helix-turn-helix (wHTH) protein
MAATSKNRIASSLFDDVEVDFATLRVQKGGLPRKLTPRAFEVLAYLLENRGRTVEKQELFDGVWKDRFVSDNALTRIIKEIRQVIGDDADAPRYIQTVPKRGYRFIAEVTDVEQKPWQQVQQDEGRGGGNASEETAPPDPRKERSSGRGKIRLGRPVTDE